MIQEELLVFLVSIFATRNFFRVPLLSREHKRKHLYQCRLYRYYRSTWYVINVPQKSRVISIAGFCYSALAGTTQSWREPLLPISNFFTN